MICDELSEEEVYEAYLLHTSLHGLRNDEGTVRARVAAYYQQHQPDETIDDALMAYLEDRIVAPPDVVLDRWGSSRFYELSEGAFGEVRHRTCEAWFENGCRLPEHDAPALVHFWTELVLAESLEEEIVTRLREGVRLQLEMQADSIRALHRRFGCVGFVAQQLASVLREKPLRDRKYLCLVDHEGVFTRDGERLCRTLVVNAAENETVASIVDYATKTFRAPRNKC